MVDMTQSSPSPKMKKRNIWLTIWIVLIIIANTWAAIANFGTLFADLYYFVPTWAVVVAGMFAIINFVFAIYLLKWKLWAFHGYLAIAVIMFVINLATEVSFFNSIIGFIGPLVLYLLMRPQWKWFGK